MHIIILIFLWGDGNVSMSPQDRQYRSEHECHEYIELYRKRGVFRHMETEGKPVRVLAACQSTETENNDANAKRKTPAERS